MLSIYTYVYSEYQWYVHTTGVLGCLVRTILVLVRGTSPGSAVVKKSTTELDSTVGLDDVRGRWQEVDLFLSPAQYPRVLHTYYYLKVNIFLAIDPGMYTQGGIQL